MSARSKGEKRRPRLAVWKFASCDGCQLSLLDCEDELLAIAGAIEIAYFPEATRAVARGPYDISLVEGSITTPHDAERIHAIRRRSRRPSWQCPTRPLYIRASAARSPWVARISLPEPGWISAPMCSCKKPLWSGRNR